MELRLEKKKALFILNLTFHMFYFLLFSIYFVDTFSQRHEMVKKLSCDAFERKGKEMCKYDVSFNGINYLRTCISESIKLNMPLTQNKESWAQIQLTHFTFVSTNIYNTAYINKETVKFKNSPTGGMSFAPLS